MVWVPIENFADQAFATQIGIEGSATRQELYDEFGLLRGKRGFTQTIYVSTTGNDSNDGKTTETAFREIRAAVASIAPRGPVFRGGTDIVAAAGTYKGGIALPFARSFAQDDFIRIIGPSVGGHPNSPTAVISFAADNTVSYGVQANNGVALWLEGVKFTGAFYIAVDIRAHSSVQGRNVHIDGAVNGLGLIKQCTYDWRGGIIENCSEVGIEEHFGITRTFENVTVREQATIIRNCGVGVRAKENCHGHLDWVIFEDNGVGLELHAWSTANVKGITLKRNGVGYGLVDSEIHNAAGIVWGTGADANGRRDVPLGNSDVLNDWGWVDSTTLATTRLGHRHPRQVASSYTDSAPLTGVTTEILAYQSAAIIPAGRLSVAGRHVRVVAWFSVVTPPATSSRIALRLAGNLTAQVPIPSTATAGQDFKVEFDVVCPADGNNQKTMGEANGFVPGANAYVATTWNLSDADFSAAISVYHDESASSFILRSVEVLA